MSVVPWLLAAAVVAVTAATVLAATGGLAVRRHSGSHLDAHLAVAGRGLYLSRTPDGTWWRLRLRRCGRGCEDGGAWGEPPPDTAVREPRPPRGPGPLAGGAELEPPLS